MTLDPAAENRLQGIVVDVHRQNRIPEGLGLTPLPDRERMTGAGTAITRLSRAWSRPRWKGVRSPASTPRRMPGPVCAPREAIDLDECLDGRVQLIRADLPGLDPTRDIEIVVAANQLRIDAFRASPTDPVGADVLRREPRYGRLTRTLPLAEGAKPAAATAVYEAGVLCVHVPLVDTPTVVGPTAITISPG